MSKKFIDRITETLGLYAEEDEFLDEELEEEPEPVKKPTPVKKVTPITKEVVKEEEPEKKSLFSRKKAATPSKKTVNMPLTKKQVKVVVIEPTNFDDSQKVADYLRNNQPVVLNFEATDKVVKKRMVDFISGTIYALGGNLKKIGPNILVCAPKNVDIDAGGNFTTDKG